MLATFFMSALLLFQIPSMPNVSPKPAETPKLTQFLTETPEDTPQIRKHTITVKGKPLNYTTTTGLMPIRNAQTGEIEAKIFYMAYTLDGVADNAKRPLMFSFNGGPGSASVWLHLGALGPKRAKMLDDGLLPPPPYDLVDNEQTWLTDTDLVFIDPVGTGYSRAAKPEYGAKFFSVNGDLDSVGETIRMYLGRYERWNSPLFLVGESYGTTRASGLSNLLFEKGIGLNGIMLVSTVLNFQTIRFAEGNDLTYPLIFPSYTATAWYHKRLPADLQKKSLPEVLRESEKFAAEDLTIGLSKGDRLSASERQTLIEKFSRLSGLNQTFVDQNNFRIELGRFNKELLRDKKLTTGRLDSRFTGIDKDLASDSVESDPSMNAIRPPYTATFNSYVRADLGFKSDLEYYILGGGVGRWDWNQNNGYANTAPTLQQAMQKNPYMKIFVACGYYDMATPYFAAEYTFATMNLDPNLRKNITTTYYEAGHMMYIEKNSLQKLKQDASIFIQKSLYK
jgi:carboxypeptidase C (cathepsin A)